MSIIIKFNYIYNIYIIYIIKNSFLIFPSSFPYPKKLICKIVKL